MMYPYRNHPVGAVEKKLPPPSPPSHTNFPILEISIVGILVTAIFLLSYYVFIIKCGLNWNHSDVIRRLSRSQRRWRNTTNRTLSSLYSSSVAAHGLDRSTIQAIPTLKFNRGEQCDSLHECAVCLNEFQDEESIRMLPICFHLFHIDCIDTWLQTHANCPLCRAEITSASVMPLAIHNVTIDVTDEAINQTPRSDLTSSNTNANSTATSTTDSYVGKERKMLHKVSSLGDECIGMRGKDEDFAVQPITRSFSMGSSSDGQLYTTEQEIMRLNPHFQEVSNGEGTGTTSNSWRIRRPFFGHCRNLRNSILPIQIEQ